MSSGLATLAELQTVYSVQDAHDLLEVAKVNAHNRRLADDKGRD